MADAMRLNYANVSGVPSRKVYRVILEGPIEQMGQFTALFGPPKPHEDSWVGIAPLRDGAEHEPDTEADRVDVQPPRPLSQIAAMLGTKVTFRRWLQESGKRPDIPLNTADMAADEVRRRCGVKSRKELDTNELAARRFRDMRSDYSNWMRDEAPAA